MVNAHGDELGHAQAQPEAAHEKSERSHRAIPLKHGEPPQDHGHTHNHAHGVAGLPRRRLLAVLLVTATIFLAEVAGAYLAGSLALLADAGHMLADSAGLLIAYIAAWLGTRPRTDEYTWGLARSEILSAAFQAGMLLVVCAAILWEGIERLFAPETVNAPLMALFGTIGLAGNIVSLLILLGVRRHNLNLRAAFLEVATDSLASVGVVAAAIIAYLTRYDRVDAIMSLIIAAVMAPRAAMLLRQSVQILLERTPADLDLQQLRAHVLSRPHVQDVHDLHVSTIASGAIAVTMHVTLAEECFTDGHSLQTLHGIQECLAEHFPLALNHCTIQLDSPRHRDHETLAHDPQHSACDK